MWCDAGALHSDVRGEALSVMASVRIIFIIMDFISILCWCIFAGTHTVCTRLKNLLTIIFQTNIVANIRRNSWSTKFSMKLDCWKRVWKFYVQNEYFLAADKVSGKKNRLRETFCISRLNLGAVWNNFHRESFGPWLEARNYLGHILKSRLNSWFLNDDWICKTRFKKKSSTIFE